MMNELNNIQDTVGIDFFYFRASVFNESIKPILSLDKLQELHLFPVIDPKELLKSFGVLHSSIMQIVHFGILNIKEEEFKNLFKIIPRTFPNLKDYSIHAQYLDFRTANNNQNINPVMND